MKIYARCKECKSEIALWTRAANRVDLKMKHRDSIELHCKLCNKIYKYSIDELKAKQSKIALLTGALILITGAPVIIILLWDYIWKSGLYNAFGLILIIGIPGCVYTIISKNDQIRVNNFNRS